MPQQLLTSVENNFTKGLITEATGLNFPENAATDTDNCEYTLIGDVVRRMGINYEKNFRINTVDIADSALNSYKWNNAGGDGETQVVVVQTGLFLNFYLLTAATDTSPLSSHKLTTTIDISSFSNTNTTEIQETECQFADGNGYLFVFHPDCTPFYCTFNENAIVAKGISVQIRDFIGVQEANNPPVTLRPQSLTQEHLYNLTNQGWTQGNPWSLVSVGDNPNVGTGSQTFTVSQQIVGPTNGDLVNIVTATDHFTGAGYIAAGTSVMSGSVTSYVNTTLVVNVTSEYNQFSGQNIGPYVITPVNHGYISTWNTAEGNYPSNSDIWWLFKNTSDAFDPTTQVNVSLNSGQAPQGHYILDAFSQQRSTTSGVSGLTDIITDARPRTGTWFQGRVWYAGVDATQPSSGDANFYTWTENIYFSQIVTGVNDFGHCYQTNDPTSQNLNSLLPTDGGVLTIQGAGAIYKLFPIQNGMLVFAANGVWFITGSQGIGFTADDYTVTKISSVQSVSSTSFVDVLGLPYFWNEEGIYQVMASQNGSLQVNPITVGTIETFYDDIPLSCKKLARGAYNPIEYVIQWVYCDTESSDVQDSYRFNKILNYNTYNKAFFPYTVDNTNATIAGINWIAGPGGTNTPDPAFKYITTIGTTSMTFSDEHDTSYVDWGSSSISSNYVSYFVTGFKLRGQAIKKWQPTYVQIYSRANQMPTAYKIQGIWDYSANANSGRWTTVQVTTLGYSNYETLYKRHKMRGHGYALQFKLFSVDGMPFDIQGWATEDTVNQGV